MSERRHPLANCEACPLNEPGNAFVPTLHATGETRLAVVGEAPGFQEATYGEPFKGPSGKLLKQVLKHHGYKDQEVMFTNACLCRPPNNATPPKSAVVACRGRLLAELASSGATDIAALGGTAASVLIDDPRTISHLRVGPPKPPTTMLSGSNVERVVASWHPAYCLRSADAFPALVNDIGKLKDVLDEPWSEPKWGSTDDPAVAREWIAELRSREGPLVIDIEVGTEKDAGFDHPNEYDLLCVGIGYARNRAIVLGSGALSDLSVRDSLRSLLSSKELVAHNGKFDLAGLYPYLGGLKLWFDTMLASYCLDERPGNHGLKVLAVEKLGAPRYDDEIKKYIPKRGNYADIPRPILYKYNAFDVACTWALYEMFSTAFDRDGETQGLRALHDHLVAASNELMYLELNGIAVDLPYNSELGNELQGRIQAIEEELLEIIKSTLPEGEIRDAAVFNPRSPMQVKAFLQSQNISVDSTDVDTLELVLKRVGDQTAVAEFVRTLLRHRKEQKLYSTYVAGIRKRVYRGRVYTTYLLHGTTSGRLSSRNPNLQNIVRDSRIKRQFVASKPSRILVHCDYKQAEARVMATLAQDDYLRRVLSDPEVDIFDDLCSQIHGADWVNLSPAKKKELRIRIKAFFYGLGYGREAPSIAAEFGMPLREAQQLQSEFFGLIPGVVKWQNDIRKKVLTQGELVTPFNRRRRFHLITEQNKRDVLNEALSYLPQSTASDICLSALIRVRPMLKGLGFVRLTIHDALVVECEDARRDEVSSMLKTAMVDCGREFTDYVPFAVDLSYGPSWGDL